MQGVGSRDRERFPRLREHALADTEPDDTRTASTVDRIPSAMWNDWKDIVPRRIRLDESDVEAVLESDDEYWHIRERGGPFVGEVRHSERIPQRPSATKQRRHGVTFPVLGRKRLQTRHRWPRVQGR